MSKYLHPKYFFLGVIVSFSLCCITGFIVSKKAWFNQFSRFILPIVPQTLYYPTANELLETVRHMADHNQILVVIGGSSILRGCGQDPDELWSTELQRLLGNRFKVINFATDAATPYSFGGVAFRMLRKEYPKIIFVGSASPFNGQGSMQGNEPYDYLFWDAYYKKLFEPYNNENKIIKQIRKKEIMTAKGADLQIVSFLDSLFYFRNLWNFISYNLMFTMYSEYEYDRPYQPRKNFFDTIVPNKEKLIKEQYSQEHIEYDQKVLKSIITTNVDFSKNSFQIKDAVRLSAREGYAVVFEPQDRSKILWVQTSYNNTIISTLPKNFKQAYWFYINESGHMIESLGYNFLNVGENFSRYDFFDFGHLAGPGGKKLAARIAVKVKKISELNGYS